MAIFDQNEQFQRNHQNMSIFNLSNRCCSPFVGVKFKVNGLKLKFHGVKRANFFPSASAKQIIDILKFVKFWVNSKDTPKMTVLLTLSAYGDRNA